MNLRSGRLEGRNDTEKGITMEVIRCFQRILTMRCFGIRLRIVRSCLGALFIRRLLTITVSCNVNGLDDILGRATEMENYKYFCTCRVTNT
jgi:hypothetical protein